ncbi:hypothetical protein H9I45_10250 [Polaribacter haliotis]|uniref:DUF4142 domain-containing protein n=1 Tax=Polaribacter haliotis TaxID=1888915 RepID=A0A7L8ACL6_9FLAO|nr:hypothetical protein [Polaribacter haliotis]QOD59732.1 hypothetical protein H9I45_10250 [Polaribacter haliotis]
MNFNKKILISSLLGVFILASSSFLVISCDTNNNGKTEEDNNANKEAKINKSQKEAKLLVMASENYIDLINYSNYVKDKDSVSENTKAFLESFEANTTERLTNLKELSKYELVLVPSSTNTSFFDHKNPDEKELNQNIYLEKLYEMVNNQINLMNTLSEESKKISISILASEAEDFLIEHNKNIKSIIDKS